VAVVLADVAADTAAAARLAEPAPAPAGPKLVPPVVVGPPLGRRVSQRREYDPLRGYDPGRRPINGR
jgi:hypothetical protein